jgi:hypothetical protein
MEYEPGEVSGGVATDPYPDVVGRLLDSGLKKYVIHIYKMSFLFKRAMSSVSRIKHFKIYRYDPDIPNQKPYLALYSVDLNKCGPMVLDALVKIKKKMSRILR